MELPAGVGSCSTHKYSTSVCLKLVRAASTTTFVTSDDKLQTKMAVDGSTDAKKLARTLLSTAAWASWRLVRAYLSHGTRSRPFLSLRFHVQNFTDGQINGQKTDGHALLLYNVPLRHYVCAR